MVYDRHEPKIIDSFDGHYDFLSNFYNAPVTFNDVNYLNNEAAFQAQKDPSRVLEFVDLPPNKAKRLGRKVKLRGDWDDVRIDIMHRICYAKFNQNPFLMQKLVMTGDVEIIEGNYWHDQIWGNCTCVRHVKSPGRNELGKILMTLREQFK